MSDVIDTKIRELFAIIEKQKAEVNIAESDVKRNWKTNCSLTGFADRPINIQTLTEEGVLNVYAWLLQRQEYVKKAAVMLGVTACTTHDGFEYDDWFLDLGKRMSAIHLGGKKTKLTSLEKRLDAIISPEQRRIMELEAITKDLT